MKYEYMLHTWGGFYNEEYQLKHGHKEGNHYFETIADRGAYLQLLEDAELRLGAKYLAHEEFEGYHTRTDVVAHRICKHEGNTYHTSRNFGPCYSYSTAVYFMENKWYPGFNDYPLGEDFDYEAKAVEVVQEWIVGAFSG